MCANASAYVRASICSLARSCGWTRCVLTFALTPGILVPSMPLCRNSRRAKLSRNRAEFADFDVGRRRSSAACIRSIDSSELPTRNSRNFTSMLRISYVACRYLKKIALFNQFRKTFLLEIWFEYKTFYKQYRCKFRTWYLFKNNFWK